MPPKKKSSKKKTKKSTLDSIKNIDLEQTKEIKKLEDQVENLTNFVKAEQKHEAKQIKKIQNIELDIEKELKEFEKDLKNIKKSKPKVIEKYTTKDIARAVFGSSLGMSALILTEEVWQVGALLPVFNTLIIFIFSLIGSASVIYFSQYRKIKEKSLIVYLLPKRLFFIYTISFLMVFFALLVFRVNVLGITPTDVIIKRVVLISFPAVIAASAADIIG